MKWFRFHAETVNNPKIQKLPPALFRTWVNLMCLASHGNGYLPPLDDIAFRLRLPEKFVTESLKELTSRHLVDRLEERFRMHDWDHWQFQSDVSTERVQRFRKRQRNVSRNGSVSGSGSVSVEKSPERNQDPNFTENEPGYWAERWYARHPKKKNLPLVQGMCVELWETKTLEIFREIDRVHALWCKTEDWQKNNGKFCPKLDEWLGDRGWTKEPEVDEDEDPDAGNRRHAEQLALDQAAAAGSRDDFWDGRTKL